MKWVQCLNSLKGIKKQLTSDVIYLRKFKELEKE